ncbi:MAG: hypothetical protein AAGA30_09775 [Planctomycetota bacterium]
MLNVRAITTLLFFVGFLACNFCEAQTVPRGFKSREQYFNAVILPKAQEMARQNLSEQVRFKDPESKLLDPSRLVLFTPYRPRIYNVGGGHAGFINGMDVSIHGVASLSGRRFRVFGNVKAIPPGHFKDLGLVEAGFVVDPILAAEWDEEVKGFEDYYYTRADLNWDGLQHVLAFSIGDTGFILLCWEDMAGLNADRDFEDVIVVLDLGETNVEMIKTPPTDLPH